MEDYLFNALYDRLGPGMTLRLEDGSVRRVLMADLPRLADEAMYPLFFSLKPWSVDYERLHSFWMESGSLSAMRALYLRFYENTMLACAIEGVPRSSCTPMGNMLEMCRNRKSKCVHIKLT